MKLSKLIAFMTIFIGLTLSAQAEELKSIIFVSNQTKDIRPDRIIREYVIGETAYFAFLAQGFSMDSSGVVDLAVDIKLTSPKGEVLFEEKDFAKAKRTVGKQEGMITLDNFFTGEFTKEDPLGMYLLEAVLKDKLSGTQDKTQTSVLLFDTEESKKIIMTPAKTAKQLDALWAEYFRSKNPWAVKGVISALRLRDKRYGLDGALVAEAAKWSLGANAKEHPDVLAICKQSLEFTKGITKELLKEVITNVEKGKTK